MIELKCNHVVSLKTEPAILSPHTFWHCEKCKMMFSKNEVSIFLVHPAAGTA